jgi:hypothetical protein
MQKNILKKSLVLSLLIIGAVGIKQFCAKKTDGFALYKILSSLPFNPDWEVASNPPVEELATLLDQPFYYLAKGAQSYVFASQDGQTVIKFFRLYHLMPPSYLTTLNLPMPLQPFRVAKMLQKQGELDRDFMSYKIAFEEMKEETGLVYLHLNKTSHLRKKLTLYDKIGVVYSLNLDEMEFLVQKRATLLYPSLDQMIKTDGAEAAKPALAALVQLLVTRCQKGIFDKDPDLNTNFGFLDQRPIQIDIGRFRREEMPKKTEEYRDEILRITDNLRQHLESQSPALSAFLIQEIQNATAPL